MLSAQFKGAKYAMRERSEGAIVIRLLRKAG